MKCMTCDQLIQPEELIDTFRGEEFHQDPADCIAATARNCHRIAREVKERSEVVTNVSGASSVMEAIQAEYPKVFAREEGR